MVVTVALAHECNQPGCRKLTRAQFCERHTKGDNHSKEHDRRRNKWDVFRKLYNTVRWKLLRRDVLMDDLVCVRCQHVSACVVDHIIPARIYAANDVERFYDRSNLQGLCESCHDQKTIEDTKKYGLAADIAEVKT